MLTLGRNEQVLAEHPPRGGLTTLRAAKDSLPFADLRALLARIERFAGGADRSEKLARELATEIGESYGSDPDLGPLVALLKDYRSRVGQVEAEQACRVAIAAVLLRLDGPRLPWRGIPANLEDRWQALFSVEAQTKDADTPWECPVCQGDRLRRYWRLYRRQTQQNEGMRFVGRGGGWAWCSDCLVYEHFQALVPDRWPGDKRLDAVPFARLEHAPEFLERALRDTTEPGPGRRARLEARDRFRVEGRGTILAARMLEGDVRASDVLELAIRPECRLSVVGIELFSTKIRDPRNVGLLVKTDCFDEVAPGLTLRAARDQQR